MTTTGRSADARRIKRGPAQWLLGLLIALAIGASIAMIFSQSRSIAASLAVIAALWAAVIGAILVTKFRRQADSAESKARDLRLVYELQLEREITARRQYELGVETQIRKEVRAETNEELGELKAQVQALRASLELLVGGDLPEQRTALQSDRLRELDRAGSPTHTAPDTGFSPPYPAFDDGVAAERDFADTAPDSGATRVPVAPPSSLTEVIPVVTSDDRTTAAAGSTSRHGAPPNSTTPNPTTPNPAPAPAPDEQPLFVDEHPTDEWAVAPAEVVDLADPREPEQMPTQQPPYTGGRHGRPASTSQAPAPQSPASQAPSAAPAPASSAARDRHRAPDPEPGAHEAGRSAAELMDQLRAGTSGGRRRRPE